MRWLISIGMTQTEKSAYLPSGLYTSSPESSNEAAERLLP